MTPAQRPLSIVYFGTAAFAIPALRALVSANAQFRVLAVVSQPDRPAGRAGVQKRSAVAEFASAHTLPLLQFESLKDPHAQDILSRLGADFFVVAAYGLIIPQAVLDIPRLGCLNLHGSLLPTYRGASPIQAALLHGDPETGVTLMKMDSAVDHGPVYTMRRIPIIADDTYLSLEKKLGDVAAELLTTHLPDIATGSLQPAAQHHAAATFTSLIRKEDGQVDFSSIAADDAVRRLRAYTPWPGVFTFITYRGHAMRLKILGMTAHPDTDTTRRVSLGTLFLFSGSPAIKAEHGFVVLLQVQPEGKRVMDGNAFIQGYRTLFPQ